MSDDWRDSAIQPDPYVDTIAAAHKDEFEPALFDEQPTRRDPLVITVSGEPIPQGSKSAWPMWARFSPDLEKCPACGQKRFVRVKLSDVVKGLPKWRGAVAHAGAHAVRGRLPGGKPLAGPLAVTVAFAVDRPPSHYRTGKNAHLVSDSAPRWPVSPRKDIDKLIRAAFDALTGVVWADDGVVVEIRRAVKAWSGEDPDGDAPARAGMVMKVWAIR